MIKDNLPTWAQEALERANAATKGLWTLIDDGDYIGVKAQGTLCHVLYRHYHQTPPPEMRGQVVIDMDFATHAHADIPRLCTVLAMAVEALRDIENEITFTTAESIDLSSISEKAQQAILATQSIKS